MRIKDVELGEHYALYSEEPKLVAVGWGHMCGQRTVELKDTDGNRYQSDARYLTPWAEFLTQQQEAEQDRQGILEDAQRLTGGKGQVEAENYYGDTHHLRLDEEAAKALLKAAGCKEPAERDLPSKAESHEEVMAAKLRLSRRIRRALAAGTASRYGLDAAEGFACQIEITPIHMMEAADDILGQVSPLAELLQ